MRKMKIVIFIVALICMSAMPLQSLASASTSQDRAMDFIENVLPIDSNQWHIELKVEGNASDVSRLDKYNISVRDDDKVLIYFLASMVGTADGIDVNFVIRENQFIYGIIDIDYAPSYSVFGRPLEIANVTDFLAKYQSWSELDSTEMVEMLSNVDIAQNTTLSSSNLTMSITRIDSTAKISWTFPDSHRFEISFKNHFPTYFYDDREIDSNTTPTPPQEDRNPPHLEPIVYLVPVSVIVAIVVLSVLLFRRHRKMTFSK
jgi:hypothetical protein